MASNSPNPTTPHQFHTRSPPPTIRPYRSKRHPPCDGCRRRKVRCEADHHGSCQRCLAAGQYCSFTRLRPRPRPHSHQGTVPPKLPSPETRPVATSNLQATEDLVVNQEDPPVAHQAVDIPFFELDTVRISADPGGTRPHTPSAFKERHTHQTIQTLDGLAGVSYQVNGASAESDPWLLRHCKFNDRGFLSFHQVHFRNAGGVPFDEKIPCHFLVSSDQLYESSKAQLPPPDPLNTHEQLNHIVPPECGQRLVVLFMKFIFPTLPIISRSHFGLAAAGTVPDQDILQRTPLCLLAAIYASAQPFAKFDDYLCLIDAYAPPATDLLWRMVLDLLLRDIHTARLSTLQAGILYLHRPISATESAVADSAFTWSLVGMLVGVAMSLGLQLDCRLMGLPLWEKRIRRRLWWAIYAEDKWRCLLIGRPSYIGSDDWDATDLSDDDFVMSECLRLALQQPASSSHSSHDVLTAQPFQQLIQLSRIADELQRSLFVSLMFNHAILTNPWPHSTLKASQRLSPDFHATLEIARPLLQKLKEWYAHSPVSVRQPDHQPTTLDSIYCQSNCLRFACILLEVFVFRALLRPMVRSAAPPPLLEENFETAEFTNQFNDLLAQLFDAEEIEPSMAIDMSDENGMGNAVLRAADNCAAKVIRLVMRMTTSDLSSFWYRWSRVGFATVSNFLLLLLVQAPTKDHALRAKSLVDLWRQTLRNQSTGCPAMNLGLVRLDGSLWPGLARNYYLPKQVKEVLEE
ncbi:fungal specific transcription factor domain protein [Aspergillus luchuensis]|uniref:Fungal specific transcription factor domain protein n=1 Tax=Aspergillus kawachii TaxID=1069201 RepID=A0A146EXS1_ASPKA|nr:fungal specific transcription factor domain protein [Aspergillus luchuensis]